MSALRGARFQPKGSTPSLTRQHIRDLTPHAQRKSNLLLVPKQREVQRKRESGYKSGKHEGANTLFLWDTLAGRARRMNTRLDSTFAPTLGGIYRPNSSQARAAPDPSLQERIGIARPSHARREGENSDAWNRTGGRGTVFTSRLSTPHSALKAS